ncbi:hypothetical protein RR46_01035 [Papilio xuthus]|uniref:Uncharacterized protein n=1 Tax=Papilio xuthus TaxID=66420 RepID=A0A0N0PA35_PAPXU|nr:hypothetical protein RR46_01035 [Papilio xuthus]
MSRSSGGSLGGGAGRGGKLYARWITGLTTMCRCWNIQTKLGYHNSIEYVRKDRREQTSSGNTEVFNDAHGHQQYQRNRRCDDVYLKVYLLNGCMDLAEI